MTRLAYPQAEKPEERYCTYKVYDPDIQKIIYVGMTSDIHRRIKQHMRSDWWKPELRFDVIEQDLEKQKAREREKYWIQHYHDAGHPLKNSNDMYFSSERWEFEARQNFTDWLKDTDLTEPEREETIRIWLKAGDGMDWNIMYKKVCTIAQELKKTHHITLSILDITRLTARAEGIDIDSEGTK